MGMEGYLTDLGLTERVLYDAQGKSFDSQDVEIEMMEGIRQWSNGEGLEWHVYEAPSRAHAVFQEVYAYTRARGLPAVESPCPYDLHSDSLADRDGMGPVLSDTPAANGGDGIGTTGAVAGHGRAGQ